MQHNSVADPDMHGFTEQAIFTEVLRDSKSWCCSVINADNERNRSAVLKGVPFDEHILHIPF